ncbi:MAG: hypothetical protein GXO59_02100 [Dictyoglomi bacterium]|nr:hypothetical protein [Dictyoglomota bacterium]
MKRLFTLLSIVVVLFVFASCVGEGYSLSSLLHKEAIKLHNKKSLAYELQPFNVSSKDGSVLVVGYYFGPGRVFV